MTQWLYHRGKGLACSVEEMSRADVTTRPVACTPPEPDTPNLVYAPCLHTSKLADSLN
jgi:hypothetical protein